MAGVKWYAAGVFHRETVLGREMSAKHVSPLIPGALIYNRLFAWKESFAVVQPEQAGLFVSNEFPQFIADTSRILPEFLYLFCTIPATTRLVNAASAGSAAVSRNRFKETEFLKFELRLPPLPVQAAIVSHWNAAREKVASIRKNASEQEASIPNLIYQRLGVPSVPQGASSTRRLAMKWSEMDRWSIGYLAKLSSGGIGFDVAAHPVEPLSAHLEGTTNGFCIRPVGHETAHRMLRLSALTPAGLDVSDTKFVEVSERIAERFSLKAGDLLICRSVGSYEMIAKCALVQDDQPSILFPDIIIRARLKETLLPDFVREVMQTPIGRSHFQSNARTAVGMWKIGAADIANFRLPVPPITVQKQITGEVMAAREKIAAERAAAAKLAADTAREIEEMILGHRPAPSLS